MHNATTAGAGTCKQHGADLVISESPAFMRLGVLPPPSVAQVCFLLVFCAVHSAAHIRARARKGT